MTATEPGPFDPPADGRDDAFLVLVNSAGDHSLWPDWRAVPQGWRRSFGPDTHGECLRRLSAR
ncbi:MbtH family NRPS accessory protein [Streptomyces xiaopingdaonensis]|uniref:MbtH family NRPS accessory protein n=1 Tax=Streptomyces xiaopingdaonensis TaxID=1565415 RepID=UPI00031101A6|nr:MbtH family NRPS accessory protein [Streptomyces xiaopingdaonensis]